MSVFDDFEPQVVAWAPGRTELAGNHLDHQGGCVLTAALSAGIEVRAARAKGACIDVASEGFGTFAVGLDTLGCAPNPREAGTPASLVRGVAAGLAALGVPIGGCTMRVASSLPAGGGMSSSAAFELAVARTLDALFGNNDADPLVLARIGKQAECDYFGKPCGLQDQAASALGGINLIDFGDEAKLGVRPVTFDFEANGYTIVLVDVRCDHSAYTSEFAQVERDMRSVATLLGGRVLHDVDERLLLEELHRVRSQLGDRAALRALHYYNEMRLVKQRVAALERDDVSSFIELTRRSGASSAQYLQNVSTYDALDQPAMVVLALAECFLEGKGACRIHGGGFGGTVQVYVASSHAEAFIDAMEGAYAQGCCKKIAISPQGAHATCL